MNTWSVIAKNRTSFFGSIGLSFLSAGVTLTLLRKINELGAGNGMTEPHLLSMAIGLLMLLMAVTGAGQALSARFGGSVVSYVRLELARRLLDLEYETLAKSRDLVIPSLVDNLSRIVSLILLGPQMAYNVLLAAAYFGYLFYISRELFACFSGLLIVTLSISFLLAKTTRSCFDRSREADDQVLDSLRALSEGKKELALMEGRRKHFWKSVLVPAVRQAEKTMVEAQVLAGAYHAWSNSVLYAAIFGVAYVGYVTFAFSAAVVSKFIIVSLFLINPIAFVTQAVHQFVLGTASLRHLERFGLGPEPRNAGSDKRIGAPARSPSDWRSMRAVGIRYRYSSESGDYELGPIDLCINRGEMIFLTGGNGSGKSTLLLLLCGLLSPSGGCIFMDEETVDLRSAQHRERFAGVFGDFYLFSHVLCGDGECASDARIDEQLRALRLNNKVYARGGRLSTLALSTGQRKRLALLQCQMQDREICFFDELAADQDVSYREEFYCVVLPEMKRAGKTLIVISHDDRYFHVADRIIRLDNGRIVHEFRRDSDRRSLSRGFEAPSSFQSG